MRVHARQLDSAKFSKHQMNNKPTQPAIKHIVRALSVAGICRTVFCTVFALSAAVVDFGQTPGICRLAGTVVDSAGAAVAGASVVVSPLKSAAVSGPDGKFSFDLAPGIYELAVHANGFASSTQTADLTKGSCDIPDVVMQVRPTTAVVDVGSEAPYVAGSVGSVTKTLGPVRDIPQSISVVTSSQIRDQSMTSIADAVRYIPGISTHQGENNRDEVVIRGNRSNADFYRDGVRDDVQYYRDLYNLERVEAIKGSNAMAFGRGGGGGVINRVTKEAGSVPLREFTAQLGSYYDRRFTADIDQPFGSRFAFRVNGMYERTDSFRRFVGLEREGINPTFAWTPDAKTRISVSYEFARDRRTADRGITSFAGRSADVPISTYYGNPDDSRVRSDVNVFNASIDRVLGGLILRNRTSYGDYDRFYQNYVPGAANAAGTLVALTAYNNGTRRGNLFNQTDLNYSFKTGAVHHTLSFGTEFGVQRTRNIRNTGYFNNTSTSLLVAFDAPQTSVPVTFRQSATDADNHLRLNLGAAYVQDQIEVSRYVQLIAGVRFDYFGLRYFNDRNGEMLGRIDRLVSPRLGVVIKPYQTISLYGSYGVSYLPSSGDQFSSLTTVTQQVKPEQFTNYEAGVKWDVRRGLFLTAAAYRLDRTNTRSTDPNDPTRIIQTGSQRTDGIELGIAGNVSNKWSMSGGYAYQNARITSATTAAAAGQQVGQVPHNTFSLWNKYSLTSRLSAGLGISYRSDMFVAVDNTLTLPGYVRADAAVFYKISEHWRLQGNIENLTNVRYFANADSNTNISPGAPRSFRMGLTARF
jgi:catecholate siderophore receptor